MGTYQYMSPEQICAKSVDHQSDIFSLGVVLYEIVTGRLPFEGENVAAMAYAIVHNDPEPLSVDREGVTGNLEVAVAKAMVKDPRQRYQAASEMRTDLGSAATQTISGVFQTVSVAKTVAVFPFRNPEGNADDAYLSEGICEDVVTAIVKMPQLSVASLSAIRRLSKRDLEVVEISQELKAGHFLEGSLRRLGETIRLNVQMTRASDEIVVWSETYERSADDIFMLQTDIANQVAASLSVALTTDELAKVPTARVVCSEAYELYLQGKFHLKKRDRASVVRAVELLHQATELDSNFGTAYGQLAVACGLCEIYGYDCLPDVVRQSHAYAERAIDLDPGSSQAHMSMYFLLRYKNLPRAISELRTATALDGSNSEAYHYLGFSLTISGYYQAAEEAELASNRLDPFLEVCDVSLCRLFFLTGQDRKLSSQLEAMKKKYAQSHVISATLGWIAWHGRRWEQACDHYQNALTLNPHGQPLMDYYADCLIRSGRSDDVRQLLTDWLERNDQAPALQARLGQLHLVTGDLDRATKRFDIAENIYRKEMDRHGGLDSALSFLQLAWVSALRRDRPTAIDQLYAAVERGYGHYAELKLRPDWDSLRGDDRFGKLISDLETQRQS